MKRPICVACTINDRVKISFDKIELNKGDVLAIMIAP